MGCGALFEKTLDDGKGGDGSPYNGLAPGGERGEAVRPHIGQVRKPLRLAPTARCRGRVPRATGRSPSGALCYSRYSRASLSCNGIVTSGTLAGVSTSGVLCVPDIGNRCAGNPM